MIKPVEQLKNEVRDCVRTYGYIRVAAVAELGSKNTLRDAVKADWNPRAVTLEKVICAIRSGAFDSQVPKAQSSA